MASAPDAVDFYDRDRTGNTRAVRKDLTGSLSGMVQFAQSHTVDPSGNEAKEMPRLTMSREAMVLITPDPAMASGIESMQLTVTVHGVQKGVLTLRHPNDIFRSDSNNRGGRPDYVYSRRAWTGVMPWDWVQPGMELRVVDSQSRTGYLPANAIEFHAPAELVVQSIRLGMLTNPPGANTDDHWFLRQPALAASDYFQTIPAAKLTATAYEDVQLSRVMVSSGVIYDTQSAGTGNVYGGDMREDTGKSTFSVGINLANFGVTSASMASQNQPLAFQTVTLHHAAGMYSNGRHAHGLSGGNSILTLYSSRYNEFSHEIGHHYGIGHYPGQNGNNYFWSAHHHDSGWGFMGHRNRMRTNILWHRAIDGGLAGQATLDNTYRFAPDSMSGGDFTSALSSYTHYTGYSTKRWIQPNLAARAVPDPTATSGYRMWDASTQTMRDAAPAVPNQPPVWYNGATHFAKPRLYGVPVITILGGYDPDTGNALLYPPLRGNWGNVFDLPAAARATEPRACWLDVQFANRAPQRIAVAGRRMQNDRVNKLHVNLAQADQPTQVDLKCQAPNAAEQTLGSLRVPVNLTPMQPPVLVGKEWGYAALRAQEMPVLAAALQAQATQTVMGLTSNDLMLLESHRAHLNELPASAQAQVRRYDEQLLRGQRLNRWLDAYGVEVAGGSAEAQGAFVNFARQVGIVDSPVMPAAQTMRMANGNCIQKVGSSGLQVARQNLCTGDVNEQWILDPRGAIRSRANLSLCLTDAGGSSDVQLNTCSTSNANQTWTVNGGRISRGTRCMDLHSGNLPANGLGRLITYNCTGGPNQNWAGLQQSNSELLLLLSAQNAPLLVNFDGMKRAQQRRR